MSIEEQGHEEIVDEDAQIVIWLVIFTTNVVTKSICVEIIF